MPIITNGLVGYWNTKQGLTSDSWLNIAPGATDSAVVFNATAGTNGLTFNNSADSHIDITVPTAFHSSQPFSLEYRVSTIGAEIDSSPVVLTTTQATLSNLYADLEPWGIWSQWDIADGTDMIGVWYDYTFLTDTVYHISFVYDGATSLKLFVNGIFVNNVILAQTIKLINANSALMFGYNLAGAINTIRLYDRALTDSEVSSNYNVGTEIGLPIPVILASDSFNRADSTTTLGTMDSYAGGTAKPWIYQSGTWGINANRAYLVSSANYDMVLLNAGASDVVIETDVIWTIDSSAGLVFRNTDNTNWFDACIGNSGLVLRKLVSGSYTTLGTYSFTPVNGTTYKLKATLNGNSIILHVDGVQRLSVTDSFNSTATLHGLRSPIANSFFDNFIISGLGIAAYSKALNDSVTVSDSITKKAAGRRLSDTQATVDSLTKKAAGKRLNDTVTSSDSLTKKAAGERLNDSISLSEVLTYLYSAANLQTKALFDSLGLSDSITKKAAGKRLNDSVTAADSNVTKTARDNLSDNVTLTDSRTIRITTFKALNDSLTLTDSRTVKLSSFKALSEAISLSDSRTIRLSRFKTLVDTISTSDSIIKKAVAKKLLDSMGITDSQAQAVLRGLLTTAKLYKNNKVEISGELIEGNAFISFQSNGDLKIYELIEEPTFSLGGDGKLKTAEFIEGGI